MFGFKGSNLKVWTSNLERSPGDHEKGESQEGDWIGGKSSPRIWRLFKSNKIFIFIAKFQVKLEWKLVFSIRSQSGVSIRG